MSSLHATSSAKAITPAKAGKSVVLDSLPYIDDTYEEYDQYAASLIEEEMKSSKPPAVAFKKSPFKYATPLLEHEYEKVSNESQNTGKPSYNVKLEAPSSTASVEELEEAVRTAKIEYEKERIRGLMLEIEKEGVTAEQWKKYNGVLDDALQNGIDPLLQTQREQVDQVNLKRQEHQERVGNRLSVLGSQYQQLVEKVYLLKRAIAAIQGEIDVMDCKRQKIDE